MDHSSLPHSPQTTTDPYTGKQTTKTSLGGAYPGQRRQNASPYKPAASEFDGNGQATAHFQAIGGGNALTLVQQDGTAVPMTTAPQYIQGTTRSCDNTALAHLLRCFTSYNPRGSITRTSDSCTSSGWSSQCDHGASRIRTWFHLYGRVYNA